MRAQARHVQQCPLAREHECRGWELIKRCVLAGTSPLRAGSAARPTGATRPARARWNPAPDVPAQQPGGRCLVLDPFYDRRASRQPRRQHSAPVAASSGSPTPRSTVNEPMTAWLTSLRDRPIAEHERALRWLSSRCSSPRRCCSRSPGQAQSRATRRITPTIVEAAHGSQRPRATRPSETAPSHTLPFVPAEDFLAGLPRLHLRARTGRARSRTPPPR